jgi:hypothetical protein
MLERQGPPRRQLPDVTGEQPNIVEELLSGAFPGDHRKQGLLEVLRHPGEGDRTQRRRNNQPARALGD